MMIDASLILSLPPSLSLSLIRFTDSSDRYVSLRTLTHWSTVLRYTHILSDIVIIIIIIISSEAGSLVAAGVVDVSPSGGIIDKLMEYIWSHWEDPIDVREGGEGK